MSLRNLMIALLVVVASENLAGQPLGGADARIMRLALEEVVSREVAFDWKDVVVECSTRLIEPTGGVPLLHDRALSVQLERNKVAYELPSEVSGEMRRVDLSAWCRDGGYDWTSLATGGIVPGGIIQLSAPGYSDDGAIAVVQAALFEPHGQRGWHWLRLSNASGAWTVVDRRKAWTKVGQSFPYEPRWWITGAMSVE